MVLMLLEGREVYHHYWYQIIAERPLCVCANCHRLATALQANRLKQSAKYASGFLESSETA